MPMPDTFVGATSVETVETPGLTGPGRVFGIWLGVVAFVALLMVTARFAFWDDYGNFTYFNRGWATWVQTGFTRDGRILHSFLMYYPMHLFTHITQLWVLRVLSLAGIVVFGWVLYRVLGRSGDRWTAALVSLFALFSPAMGVNLGWANNYPYGWAMAGSVLAARIVLRREWRWDLRSVLVGCGLLLGGMVCGLIYQPLIGLAVLPLLYSLQRGESVRNILVAMGLLLVVYAGSFGLYKLLPFIHQGWGSSSRAGLSLDPQEALLRLYHLLPALVSGWLGLWGGKIGGWIGAAITLPLFGLGLYAIVSANKGRDPWVVLAIAFMCIGLAGPHIFVMKDTWAYRTHVGVYAAFFAIVSFGIIWLARRLRIRESAPVSAIAGVLPVMALASVHAGIVHQATIEFRVVEQHLSRLARNEVQGLQFVLPYAPYSQLKAVPFPVHGAYGVSSYVGMRFNVIHGIATEYWEDVRFVPYVFIEREHARQIPGVPVVDLQAALFDLPPQDPLPASPPETALDTLRSATPATNGRWVVHPQWGPLFQESTAVFLSPTFGKISQYKNKPTDADFSYHCASIGYFKSMAPDDSTLDCYDHRVRIVAKEGKPVLVDE